MTNVYEANVRFMKRVQVREYEPMEGEVTFKAQFPDGSDHVALSNVLMQEAREVVLGGLRGIPKPDATVTKTETFKNVEPKASAGMTNPAAAPAAEPAEPTAAASDIPDESPKPARRGRPSKAEMEARSKAAAAARGIPGEDPVKLGAPVPTKASDIPEEVVTGAKAAAAASDIPGEGVMTGAKAAASDIPGEGEQEEWEKVTEEDKAQPISATDLQNHISLLVEKRKVTVPRVKAILAEFGAAQCRNLKPEELILVKNKIDEMVAGA